MEAFRHLKMAPCPFHVGVMFRFHKELPIDCFLKIRLGPFFLGVQLHIWLIFRIQGCTKMQLDFGKKKVGQLQCCKKKNANFSTNKRKTNNQKQTTRYIHIIDICIYIRNGDNYNCDSILHDKNYAKRK